MLEKSILSALINEESYTRQVIPYIKDEYFDDPTSKLVFKKINEYINKYNALPTKEALKISVDSLDNVSDDIFKSCVSLIDSLDYDPLTKKEWLIDETEKFCQDKALFNAVRKSILILDQKNTKMDKGMIPELLSDALSISFDSNIGHDFIDNFSERYDYYHKKDSRIPFDLDIFNKITKGGLARKSLSVILAGTAVGKTMFMTHCAASNLMQGLNVLYITLEMAEERIAERIDANLLDLTIEEIKLIPKDLYEKKINRLKRKTTGKLIVKEYPPATVGSSNFRHIIQELKMKRGFEPDIIYVDYINLAVSSRIKSMNGINSYTYVKAIAEELRGLGVELNVPLVTATQTTRSGYSNSDVGLEDTSESFGLPATADFMFALVASEELEALGQVMVKQLKNRWGDPNYYKRFVIGVDRSKMKFFDVEDDAQKGMMKDTPIMDKGSIGDSLKSERKSKFEDFK